MLPALVGLLLVGGLPNPGVAARLPQEPAPKLKAPAGPPTLSDEAIRALIERSIAQTYDGEAAAAKLVQLGARAVPFVIEALAKPDEEGERLIQLAFHLADYGPVAKGPMLKALAEGNDWQKLGAAMAFSRIASRLNFHPFDAPEGMRKPVKESPLYRRLAFVLEEDVIRALRANLRTHSSKAGACQSIEFFAHVGGETAVEDLLAATSASDVFVATAAFGALLWNHGEEDLPKMRAIFDRVYAATRKDEVAEDGTNGRLTLLLNELPSPSGLRRAMLLDLLGHPAKEVRLRVVRKLARRPILSARTRLEKLYRNEGDADVRRAALLALVAMYPKRTTSWVRAAGASKDPLDRACAAEACPKLSRDECLALIRKLAADSDATVRARLAVVLWDLLYPEAEAALVKLAKDPDPKVRAAATTPPPEDESVRTKDGDRR